MDVPQYAAKISKKFPRKASMDVMQACHYAKVKKLPPGTSYTPRPKQILASLLL